ncbi:hypothetical protein Lalb_Chr20g0114471 [Lupinus albus]|uniref:CWZF3/5/7 THD domain-containing protein n=1 Tax=Lupinus albus TaxID=3870 RepID=A0A6A4NUU2_LUPAL|nr:hypothetical protein Lalb_Chr20g0114471 [Lupinus albus]
MAVATLAYKCMEVAYMRVVYCKDYSIIKDWHELQSTLKIVSQDESPSSSASDVDNLNNQTTVKKATFPRGTGTHVSGNLVLSAETRPNFVRLLDFTQDINFAMEASAKCQRTFALANVNMEEAQNRDCVTSIKRVIDFSFQNVDEFLHLISIATNAIRRAGLGDA